MGRRSTIQTLPPGIVAEVNRLVREGRTIDSITRHLELLSADGQIEQDVSRSSVGRYVMAARMSMDRMRQASEFASLAVPMLGEQAGGDIGLLVGQMLKTLAYQMTGQMQERIDDGGKQAPKAMDVMLLAKTIRDLEALQKGNLERRALERKTILEEAATKTKDAAMDAGLTDAQWELLRAKFLGISEQVHASA